MNKIIKTSIFAIALALLPMASQAENKTPQTGNKGKEVKLEKQPNYTAVIGGPSRAPIYNWNIFKEVQRLKQQNC